MKKSIYSAVYTAFLMSLLAGCVVKEKSTVHQTLKKEINPAGGMAFKEIIDLPCQGLDSNIDYIVVSGEGKSMDRTIAKERAMLSALGALSSKLQSVVTRNMQRVSESETVGSNDANMTRKEQAGPYEQFNDRIMSIVKEASEANVSGYRVACEKNVIWEDGSYGCFVALEYAKRQLVKQLYEGLTVRGMLKVDYEYNVYKEKFDEDLKIVEDESKKK